MRGTECDYHGSSEEPFRYGDRDFCWRCEADMLVAIDAVKRVRKLHRLYSPDGVLFCDYCLESYPCKTIKALDEEQK